MLREDCDGWTSPAKILASGSTEGYRKLRIAICCWTTCSTGTSPSPLVGMHVELRSRKTLKNVRNLEANPYQY